MKLQNYIHTHNNILNEKDHQRFITLCDQFDFGKIDRPNGDEFYNMKNTETCRFHVCLSRSGDEEELWNLCHKVMLKTIPIVYSDYEDFLPEEMDLYNKYSGYWLCKYPETGRITYHADLNGDAGSVTVSYGINDDYEGGELRFWKTIDLEKKSNSVHIYPSNFLYPHEVTPVTKGIHYSIVCWFGYEKGQDWSLI